MAITKKSKSQATTQYLSSNSFATRNKKDLIDDYKRTNVGKSYREIMFLIHKDLQHTIDTSESLHQIEAARSLINEFKKKKRKETTKDIWTCYSYPKLYRPTQCTPRNTYV